MRTTHAGALMPHLPAGSADAIAWYAPIDDRFTGTLNHANSGVGACSSFAPTPTVQLYAGVIGWTNETVVWSIGWASVEDASPVISASADGWVEISWVNIDGSPAPIGNASIGTLTLTATINGVPIVAGQRLLAVTTPPTIDYPAIAWGPE